MITTYDPPGLRIRQLLASEPVISSPNMAACVVAPQYLLSRFNREVVVAYAFDSAGAAIPLQFKDSSGTVHTLPSDYAVDEASLALYATKVEAALASFTDGDFSIPDISQPHVLKILNSTGAAKVRGASTINTALRTRPVTIGDIILTTGTSGGPVTKRRVRSLRGVTVAAADADPEGSDYNPSATSAALVAVSAPTGGSAAASGTAFSGLAEGSLVDGQYGEEYIVTCTIGAAIAGVAAARFNITTVSGHFSATNVAATDSSNTFQLSNTAVFGGRTIKLTAASNTVVTGDVFRFKLKGAYARLTMNTHLIISGTYTGTKDTNYIIEVLETNTTSSNFTGARVRIIDSAGIDDVIDTVTITDNVTSSLGSLGLLFKFTGTVPTQGGLRVGDKYFVTCTAEAESTTEFDKIVLDGPAVDTALFPAAGTVYAVAMRLEVSGRILADASPDEVAWTFASGSLTYEASLSALVAGRSSGYEWCALVDAVGTISPSFRAAVPVTSNNIVRTVTSTAQITELAGPDDLDNDLGYALNRAFEASGGKTTYFINTGGITKAAFETALAKLSSVKACYYLAIITTDQEVVSAARAHVGAASTELRRFFRKCYFGIDSPGRYRLVNLQPDLQYYTCTVTSDGSGNRLVTLVAGDLDFTVLDLSEDDLFVLPQSDDAAYPILEILSSTELLLKSGPSAPLSPSAPFYIDKANTVANQKAYVRGQARAQGNDRVTGVWVENGTSLVGGATTVIPNRFLAAFVAGLRAGLLPQQGTTRYTVPMIVNASAMYGRYTEEDLNEVAADGVMVITQDEDTKKVYIRHQITTNVSEGSLYYEDNVRPILDYLSFRYDDGLDPLIGKRNVTSGTLTDMRRIITDISTEASLADYNSEIGPMIVSATNIQVVRSTLAKDRVLTSVDVDIPTPLNNITHTINGSYSSATPA